MHTKPLIVAATRAEIADSIPLFDKNNVPYLITGVGMVATAYSLTKVLAKERFPYILNVGIAGSFKRDIGLGTLVEIVKDSFSELGAEDHDQFCTIEELGFGQALWTCNPAEGISTGLQPVEGITVNTVHGNDRSISQLLQRYPSISTESMEGAAVFYVCAAENISCLQVRAISNYVEARDRNRWNIPLAVRNLNNWLQDFLKL